MHDVERIHEWRGQQVVDKDGERLGKLDEVFYAKGSGEAAFASVKSGALRRRRWLVPLADATVGRDYVRVAYAREQVRQVQSAEADGVLDPDALRSASIAYRLELPEGAVYESASLIQRRSEEAEAAARRADELEREALRRADEVKDAHGEADEATRRAEQAERDVALAQQDAVEARAAADAARRAAGSGGAAAEGDADERA